MNLDSQTVAAPQNTTALPALFNNDSQDASVLARKTAADKSRTTGYPSQSIPRLKSNVSHPPSISTLVINTNGTENADKLKNLLLELSRDPDHSQFKTILRLAADQVRVKAFGYNRATTKRRIVKLLEEFHCLEIEDLMDETGIDANEIKSALIELVEDCKITEGRRRRWQEPGKHYNPIFELVV
jgi:hypothetical protein